MTIKLIPSLGFELGRVTEAVASEYSQIMDLVRQALRTKLSLTPSSNDYWVDIRGIWPDRVVAMHKGRLYSYPYSIAADNTITIGEATEVVVDYVRVVESKSPAAPQVEGAAFREAADGSIEVTLIRAGASGNGNYYGDAALKEAVPMFEGVRVFVKQDAEHLRGEGKDVRNLLGAVYGVSFIEGKATDTGSLVGTFKPINPKDAVVTQMTEAVKRGMQGLMGLSIDALAKTKKATRNGKPVREAVKFTKVYSVDLIVEPGAGGGLDRLTEAAADSESLTTGETTMPLWKQRLLEAIKQKDAAKHAAINAETIGDDELVELHEAICGALVPPAGQTRVTEAQADDTPVTRAELAMIGLRQSAARLVAGSKLPQPAKDRLAARFETEARFTEAEVKQAIKDEGDYLGRFAEAGARVPAFDDLRVEDRSVRIAGMLDAFFDPAHADHRTVRSFKECYIEITGDRDVTGLMRNCDRSRMRESLGRFAEALDSTSWADALGDSITRRMQAIYTGQTDLQAWRRVARSGPVNDFRTQERFRIGGYGNLPAVAQSGSYDPLNSPGDDKATYAATKRGGTEKVTLEMITNDDVQSVRAIPGELALAAGNTLYEFVFDFFRTNPVIYDGVALYHASHSNLFTAALSKSEFALHRLAMLKQTRAGSAKRLATAPAMILVPFELQETAHDIFVRDLNNDKSFIQDINPEVLPVSYWTDANDWVACADPARLPAIEIGFLGGREEPELFVQDMPNVGSLFSNDQITWKIRHIYGGGVLVDGYKATTKAVVA